MKILELGTKKYQPSYIYTCEQCGCKFQFFEWELRRINPKKDSSYKECNCPQCNNRIFIFVNNLEDYKE